MTRSAILGVVSALISLAVLLDTSKSRLVNQLSRRKIRVEPGSGQNS